MKAAVYHGIKDIRLEEVAIPQITDREVLIKCRAAAVCGTDLRIYQYGHSKIPAGATLILGHELSGDVADAGVSVTAVKKGMRVFIAPNIGCGKCSLCLQWSYHLCNDYEAIGLPLNGGFAEYVKIPERAVEQGVILEIPESLSYEEAALNEPMACVYNGFTRCAAEPGDTVVIFGAGPIGIMHVMMTRIAGASRIFVVEISEERLRQAENFGADTLINSQAEDVEKRVLDETDGKGANLVITACPSPDAQKIAPRLAAIHGKINFFGGLPKGKDNVSLNTNLFHYKELMVTGSHGCNTYHCKMALDLQASGNIDLKPLVTNKFPLDNIKEAFDMALTGQGLKTVILP